MTGSGNMNTETIEAADGPVLVRRSGPFELLSHLFHDLGVQSNVVVSARYHHSENSFLTPVRIFRALDTVISEHPALTTIGVSQPSHKKDGNHRLWEARLLCIDLKLYVEFVDDLDSADAGLSQVIEKVHNQWFDTQDKTRPWWKIIIVNQTDVLFVYHHSIADGISGYAFHRSLLVALNENESTPALLEQSADEIRAVAFASEKIPPPYPLDLINEKLSWAYVIYCFLFWVFLRIFVNKRHFLFSDATFSKTHPTTVKPLPAEERTVTKVEALKFDSETMKNILEMCREHKTSFTAFLHTLIQVTLAADVYTNAKLGFSRQAVNIRSLLRFPLSPDDFTNAASQYCRVQFLGRYRAAGTNPVQNAKSQHRVDQNFHVDDQLFWKLAREYKRGMNDFIYKSKRVLQEFLTGKLLGEDEEDAGTFYGLALYQNNSFLVSNLGVFDPKEDTADGGWIITDIGFSAGAIRAAIGDIGISFNVASVRHGDCIVYATYERGVLKDEMVKNVLEGVESRLRMLL